MVLQLLVPTFRNLKLCSYIVRFYLASVLMKLVFIGLSLRDQKKNDIALYFKYFNWFYQLS